MLQDYVYSLFSLEFAKRFSILQPNEFADIIFPKALLRFFRCTRSLDSISLSKLWLVYFGSILDSRSIPFCRPRHTYHWTRIFFFYFPFIHVANLTNINSFNDMSIYFINMIWIFLTFCSSPCDAHISDTWIRSKNSVCVVRHSC